MKSIYCTLSAILTLSFTGTIYAVETNSALGAIPHQEFKPTQWVPDNTIPSNSLRILVVDAQRKPVVGAIVGDSEECMETNFIYSEETRQRLGGIWIPMSDSHRGMLSFSSGQPPQISDQDGTINIPIAALFVRFPEISKVGYTALLVLHPERKIGALVSVRGIDLGSCATVVLYPLCLVSGSFIRSDGESILKNKFIGPDGKPVKYALVGTTVLWDQPWWPVCSHSCFSGKYEVLLPPGRYCLLCTPAGGYGLRERRVQVDVREGQLAIHQDIQLEEDRPDRFTFTPDHGTPVSGRDSSVHRLIHDQKKTGRLVFLLDDEGFGAYEESFHHNGEFIRSTSWRDGRKESERIVEEREGRKYSVSTYFHQNGRKSYETVKAIGSTGIVSNAESRRKWDKNGVEVAVPK